MSTPGRPGGARTQPGSRAEIQSPAEAGLPEVKYFENGKLRPELLDEEAMQVGKLLARLGLRSAQLRRFYGDVLALRRRFEIASAGAPVEQRESVFQEILPEFRLLKAKAFYANKRRILPVEMKEFLERHVRAVKTWEDFHAFCRHFEAVVAFHYAFAKE